MIIILSAIIILSSQGLAQEQQRDPICIEDNGFFEDPEQCDAYYRCVDGKATWELCPDGLGFLFYPSYTGFGPRCDFLIGVKCGDRTKLQPPQPTTNCERKYGIFTHKTDCSRFWQCDNGDAYEMQCPYTLAFNEVHATCDYFENVPRCKAPEAPVQCPNLNLLERLFNPHPLLPDPEDCSQFYICMSGKHPRIQGCPPGTFYNSRAKVCEDQDLVDCEGRPRPATEEETNYNSIGGQTSSSRTRSRSRSSGRSLDTSNTEEAFVDPDQDLEKVSYAEVDDRHSQATEEKTRTYEDTRTYQDTRSYEERRTYESSITSEDDLTTEAAATTEAPTIDSLDEPVVIEKKPAKKLTIVGKKDDRTVKIEKTDEVSRDDDSTLVNFNFGRTSSQESRKEADLVVSADLSTSS